MPAFEDKDPGYQAIVFYDAAQEKFLWLGQPVKDWNS